MAEEKLDNSLRVLRQAIMDAEEVIDETDEENEEERQEELSCEDNCVGCITWQG